MLKDHFKLKIEPFGTTPDDRFLYLSGTHREALSSLLYGLRSGRGFVALIARPGMGKTTLLFHLLRMIGESARTAFLFQTLCAPDAFLRALLADFAIEDEDGDIVRMHKKLNDYLLRQSHDGRDVVVVIDEAQGLDERVLELVRMLSNFETPRKKLIHLVLAGQPQLAEKLASEGLTQLRQRISIVAKLAPLNGKETREYIEHRLQVAGAPAGHGIFSAEACGLIAQQSEGIPRNINNLCFNSMTLACALKKSQVHESMVREAIGDLELATAVTGKEEITVPDTHFPAPRQSRGLPVWRRLVSVLGLGLLVMTGLLASIQTSPAEGAGFLPNRLPPVAALEKGGIAAARSDDGRQHRLNLSKRINHE
jgi:general secretion pathway protein A